jgi:TonB family protein
VPLTTAIKGRGPALAAVGAIVFVVWAIIAFVSSGGVNPPETQETNASPPAVTTAARPPESPVVQQSPVPPQPALYVGTVTDAATGRPIADATVRIESEGIQTLKSGRLGEFSFTRESTARANARFQVSATGYVSQSETVDLTRHSPLLFQLRREPTARAAERVPAAAPVNAAPAPARAASSLQPVRVGGNIKPPIKTKNVAPVYPAAAQAAGVQGVVIIELTIGPKGNVQDARVLRSVPGLDQAAVDAVRQWEYAPTLLNGTPVAVLATVSVQFRLAPPATADPLLAYVTRLESAKNVGAAIDLLNKVFHVHAGGWNTTVVFSTLRERITKATPDERAAALKIVGPQ